MVTGSNLLAGTIQQLREHSGDWVFVDLGFSAKGRTCGFLHVPSNASSEADTSATEMQYGDMKKALVDLVKCGGQPLHIVLEAPLSAAFQPNGNPLGRSVELENSKHRYWYESLGCSVLLASLYLIKALVDAHPAREVRLFEGFVSFKSKTKSNHAADVLALKTAIWSGRSEAFSNPVPLLGNSGSVVTSTLELLGLGCGPPPIIKVSSLS